MVFGLSVLNRVCNVMQVCPLNRVWTSPKQGVVARYSYTIHSCAIVFVEYGLIRDVCRFLKHSKIMQNERVCILSFVLIRDLRYFSLVFFCPKQGQAFNTAAAPLYRNMRQVPPPGVGGLYQNTWYNGHDMSTRKGIAYFQQPPVLDLPFNL